MSRRRVFVPQEQIRGGSAYLPADQAHHLRDVLRAKAGDEIEVFDGEGNAYIGNVELRQPAIVVHSLRTLGTARNPVAPLILASALIKSDRFEWILQKGTELGVSEFIPLETRYSEVRIPESKMPSRLERWNRILLEATRQCGGTIIPRIRKPLAFFDFLKLEEQGNTSKFLFHERAAKRWKGRGVQASPALLCIGPEGGWHSEEVEAACRSGFQIFNLGKRILRSETAALAVVALIQLQSEAQ